MPMIVMTTSNSINVKAFFRVLGIISLRLCVNSTVSQAKAQRRDAWQVVNLRSSATLHARYGALLAELSPPPVTGIAEQTD